MFTSRCKLASESGYLDITAQLRKSNDDEVSISPSSLSVKERICLDLTPVIDYPETNAHLMLIITFWIFQQVVGVLLEEKVFDWFLVGKQEPVILGHAPLTLPADVFAAVPAGKCILPVSNLMLNAFKIAILNFIDFVKHSDRVWLLFMYTVVQVHKRVSLVAL